MHMRRREFLALPLAAAAPGALEQNGWRMLVDDSGGIRS